MGLRALVLGFLLLAMPARAIDGNTSTIASVADINSRRATLATQTWGTASLPTAVPNTIATVTLPVFSPPMTNVARVDAYTTNMTNGQTNTSNLYIANNPNNNRVVILNPGHQNGCDWTAFTASYRMKEVLQALLSAGYNVFAMNMPNCGDAVAHKALFTSYGATAMGYFLEPAIRAMNQWDASKTFLNYNMTGLSGGGWTTTVLSGLDPRIKTSVPIAGSWPGIIFTLGCVLDNCGDTCTVLNCAEQQWTAFYTTAGYADLYVMASYGQGRRSYQILNFSDDCCFGNTQYVNFGAPATYSVDYPTYQANYTVSVQALVSTTNVKPINFGAMIDYTSTSHQISAQGQANMLSIMGTTQTGGIAWLH